MENRILKADKILSFDPHPSASNYTLTEVNIEVRNRLINLVNKLEQIPQVHLCLRGDSKRNITDHDLFFNNELSKIFIVGEKSRSNIQFSPNDTYHHYENNSHNIIDDIKRLVKQVNIKIAKKPNEHKITGYISSEFIRNLGNKDSELLRKWKLFFLSFLHNNGGGRSFNNFSPFISLAYGYKKYVIARRFALKRCLHKKGILFLYSLNAGWPYYIRTIDFTKELKKFNITWYKDIHKEIMLINGMYPHYLLGVFEVEPCKNSRFVINPWLYKTLQSNNKFDYAEGIQINQKYFREFAECLGYSNFFFHYMNDNDEYVSELNQNNHYKVYQP